VVDTTKHDDWHHYHQQQLIRMVEQIDRQQKVTGKLIVRFSSAINGKGGADSGITVDLLAFATCWIGAGVAIGVLAWSVSERRWLPAGAMLLFALVAIYLAYREIRPSKRRTAPSAAQAPEPWRAAQPSPVPQQQPAQHQPTQPRQPAHQPQPQPQSGQSQWQQPQWQPPQRQQQAAAPSRQAQQQSTAQTAAVPAKPHYPQPSYNSKAPNGQAPDNTQNGWNRRGDGWR
jgi:outer membrane biosynthesis protein TonB